MLEKGRQKPAFFIIFGYCDGQIRACSSFLQAEKRFWYGDLDPESAGNGLRAGLWKTHA
jgi:hypothetical protein